MIMTGRIIVLSLCILLGLSSVSAQQIARKVELKPVLEIQYLLDQIEEEYRVDRSRVWVAGLSRGGYGAWRMAIQYPDRFAALVAVCGETPDHYAAWLGDMPIWVFHGEDDRTISVKESDEMVAALRKNGNPVRYTKYPNTGHNAWDQAFSDPELYTWLMAQKKK